MRKIIIFMFIFCINIFADTYKPKNEREEEILSKYRKQTIKLGSLNTIFYTNTIVDNISINEIIESMLKDYLQLNIEIVNENFKSLFDKYRDKKIDGILTLGKTNERGKETNFSDVLYNESLYVASMNKEIDSLDTLKNQEVNVLKGTSYHDFIKMISENNDMNIRIKDRDTLYSIKDGYIITPTPLIYMPKSYLRINQSSSICIALNNEYKELLPIINRAIQQKYKDILRTHISKMQQAYLLKNFKSSLTIPEKEYLSKKKKLVIAVDKNDELIYKSLQTKELDGKIPDIFNAMKKSLDLDVEYKIVPYVTTDIRKSVDDGEIDIVVLSKTKEREEYYTFSNKIFDFMIYSITKKKKSSHIKKIGVLSDSVEQKVALRYEMKDNIKVYNNELELKKDLDRGKIAIALVVDLKYFSSDNYIVELFEKIPINLAVKKNNKILRDILNKGLIYSIDLKGILRQSEIGKKANDTKILLKNEREKKIGEILVVVLLMLAFFIFTRYLLKIKSNRKLLKDPLTGLNNRVVFNKFCKKLGDKLNAYIFVIDFNNFKNVNDKYGHEFGDFVLEDFAKYLKTIFPEKNIFRISGDEFYGYFTDNLDYILDKLSNFKEHCHIMNKFNVSFNLGIYKKRVNESIEEAFKYADLAMLDTKGKKDEFYKIADKRFIKQRKKEFAIIKMIEGDLKEFFVAFQPEVYAGERKIIGVEALARCYSPLFGEIYPNEFIKIAEKYDKAHKIDYLVIEEICKKLKKVDFLDDADIEDGFRFSFNLSLKTFLRKNLISEIKEILDRYEVDGRHFEVEITESFFGSNIKEIIEKLNALKDLGMIIALDDFTAGHSTTGVLPLLPIKVVKFDKTLLDSIRENNSKGRIIYENLVSLIQELNMQIVAEGVERKEDLEFLKRIGVDCVQGFITGRPQKYENLKMNIKK